MNWPVFFGVLLTCLGIAAWALGLVGIIEWMGRMERKRKAWAEPVSIACMIGWCSIGMALLIGWLA